MNSIVSPAAMMAEHSSGNKTSLMRRKLGTMGCLWHSVFGPSPSSTASFCRRRRRGRTILICWEGRDRYGESVVRYDVVELAGVYDIGFVIKMDSI